MTSEQLTALLAERVMGWTVGPDRFTMGSRKWMPRWRFNPTENLEDAVQLLSVATPQSYSIHGKGGDGPHVEVRIDGRIGVASGASLANAITMAVARAAGIEVPDDDVATVTGRRRP